MNTSSTFDPERYHVMVSKIVEDGETMYRGTVRELPDLAVYAGTHGEAYNEAIVGVCDLHDVARDLHKPFPEPVEETSAQQFTGRVTLRLPSGLHQRAATCAEYDGVSLNTWLVAAIGEVVGERRGTVRAKETSDAALYAISQAPIISLDEKPHVGAKATNMVYTTYLTGSFASGTRRKATGSRRINRAATESQA